MRLKLTQWQVNALRPYFDRVQAASVRGTPGMLVAQLRSSRDSAGGYVMIPAFLDHEEARLVTERGRELVVEGPSEATKDEAHE